MTNGHTAPPARDGGQGGIYAMLVVIIVLIVAAVLYFSGTFGRADDDIEIDANIEMPGTGGGGAGTGGGGSGTGG